MRHVAMSLKQILWTRNRFIISESYQIINSKKNGVNLILFTSPAIVKSGTLDNTNKRSVGKPITYLTASQR